MNKNIVNVLSIVLCIIVLTGCSFNENKEKSLCNKINDDIANYEGKKISFEIFANKIKNYYNKDCKGNENSDVCSEMTLVINRLNVNYQLEDCNIYPEGSFKEVCVSRNNITQDFIDNKDKYDSSAVGVLGSFCKN